MLLAVLGASLCISLPLPAWTSGPGARVRDCGPRCLVSVCDILGVRTSLEEMGRLSGLDPRHGVSMEDLALAAKRKGLAATGLRLTVDELAEIRSPCIVHNSTRDHFFVVSGFRRNKFVVIDPPGEPRHLSKSA